MTFYRSNHGKLFGVCEGLGDYFRIDPFFPRLAFAVALFTPFPAALVYFLITLLTSRHPNPTM